MLKAFGISCFNFIVTNITISYSNATAKSHYPELVTFDLNSFSFIMGLYMIAKFNWTINFWTKVGQRLDF